MRLKASPMRKKAKVNPVDDNNPKWPLMKRVKKRGGGGLIYL